MGEKTAYYSQLGITPIYYDDRYELLSTIGRGKSSVVYLASKYSKDETIDLDVPSVALKVLLNTERDPEASIRRIKKESLALLSCIHPSIIRMHDYVAREDACYISMEYAKYGDLKNLLKADRSFLSPLATLKLTQELLKGVGAIHSAGILHRDIKPENILLSEDYQVKICDFSVCLLKGEKPNLNLLTHVVGTIDYLAPECLSGKGYSISSDLYSVGVTAYELLTGNLPFAAKSMRESLEKKKRVEILDMPEEIINKFPALDKFFKKALDANPEKRFLSHGEMAKAIDEVINGTFLVESDSVLSSKVDFSKINENVSQILEIGKQYYGTYTFPKLNLPSIDFKRFTAKLKKLSKFFIISFLATIAFFCLIKTISFFDSTTEVTTSTNNLKSEEESYLDPFKFFSTTSGLGVISGLYTDDKNYRFVLSPTSDNKALFVLLVKGWEPVEVDLTKFKENKPINIVGKGINILLKVTEIKPDSSVNGTYENLVTARTGNWTFHPTSR